MRKATPSLPSRPGQTVAVIALAHEDLCGVDIFAWVTSNQRDQEGLHLDEFAFGEDNYGEPADSDFQSELPMLNEARSRWRRRWAG
ncbi:hypothetical protein [Paraburkholderia sp. BR10954]|uniref:hypothetical protein n=1 Tax=Paraburkholderia sp. BR10954 TaxID=3236995 RepID=UPI0034D38F41